MTKKDKKEITDIVACELAKSRLIEIKYEIMEKEFCYNLSKEINCSVDNVADIVVKLGEVLDTNSKTI